METTTKTRDLNMENHRNRQPDNPHEIHPLIRKRWSPRAFSEKRIEENTMKALFEAARWAPSSNNAQPWEYLYAFRGTPGFERLWNCLKPGNQPWAKNAAVLMVCLARKTFKRNGNPNPWAEHDLGLANAQLILEAASRDIYGHMMAGFYPDKLKETAGLHPDLKPVCLTALGYLGDAESLSEPYRTRELTPGTRKAVEAFTRAI